MTQSLHSTDTEVVGVELVYKQVTIYGLVEAGAINLSFAVVWNYGSSLNLPSWVPDRGLEVLL